MTTPISGLTETTEPLAPAAPAAATGRAPAGVFDLLIALLQASPVQAALLQTALQQGAPLAIGDEPAAPASGEAEAVAGQSSRAPFLGIRTVAVARHLALVVDAPVAVADRDADEEPAPSPGTAMPASTLPATLAMAPMPASTPPSPAPLVESARPSVPETSESRPSTRPALPAFGAAAPPLPSRVEAATVTPVATEIAPQKEPVAAASAPTVSTPAPSLAELPREPGAPALGESRPLPVRRTRALERGDAVDAAAPFGSGDIAQDLEIKGAPRLTRVAEHEAMSSRPQARAANDSGATTDVAAPDPKVPSAQGSSVSMTPRTGPGDVERTHAVPVHDPIDQIAMRLRDVKSPGRHEISVRLDPPDLGTVRIEARLDGPNLQVQIRAEQAPTRELLADALPRLRESLAQQGFVPTDVSVQLGLEGSGRQFTRDSAPTFTPPDAEPAPLPKVVPAAARAAAVSDGLDLWA